MTTKQMLKQIDKLHKNLKGILMSDDYEMLCELIELELLVEAECNQ